MQLEIGSSYIDAQGNTRIRCEVVIAAQYAPGEARAAGQTQGQAAPQCEAGKVRQGDSLHRTQSRSHGVCLDAGRGPAHRQRVDRGGLQIGRQSTKWAEWGQVEAKRPATHPGPAQPELERQPLAAVLDTLHEGGILIEPLPKQNARRFTLTCNPNMMSQSHPLQRKNKA